MAYWLLKSEPNDYSFDDMEKDKTAPWDGVRNYQARNNMMKMKKGDSAFFYHSVSQKAVVGIVKVVKEHYPDPVDETNRFVCVDVKFSQRLKNPVSLDKIKSTESLAEIALVKQSRLSVMPLTPDEWDEILHLSNS